MTLTLTLVLGGTAQAAAPSFGPPVRLDERGATEPRIAIGANDTRYVTTTRKKDDAASVFISRDKGRTWAEQPTIMPGQTAPTIDVDVIAMAGNRILSSELDTTGLNFPTGVSDDDGKTWKQSTGSVLLADQDRQWFAAGPPDPTTHKPRVYLLYHNLATGFGLHNMWVATSNDGGETFGAPVPTTLPGSDAFADLQCADSGGPSAIFVNQKTGRIYVVFTTRGNPIAPGVDLGGCASQPIEANIVAATRVWVASSDTGALGSWKQSLAVDDAPSGKIVSMQLATGALDNQGGVWIAYPESPRPYPDYSGAGVKITHADADLSKWATPSTLVPYGGAGSLLTHLAVGDPGKVDVAYYKGVERGGDKEPVWYTHVVQSLNAGDATPTVTDTAVSAQPVYAGTASTMMGACNVSGQNLPIEGVLNGFLCDRSTDVWGVALDADCNLSVVWPGRNEKDGDGWDGTYVATQTGGSRLCGAAAEEGGSSQSPQGPFCRDASSPSVTRARRNIRASRRSIVVRGTASDRGCVGGVAGRPVKVRKVQVAVARVVSASRCRFLSARGRLGGAVACSRPRYLTASGTSRWRVSLRGRFGRGRYALYVRAIDRAGNVTPVRRAVRFSIR